ncbi:TonB-dependent receptor [Novosphingobium sp. TH158]|uniref:TonB-dependent receptor n=1 Tax=Novosphingobium sp. TH158 TaxID=2067455 RepID=UPI000C7DD653|nr:TonB-dependent receptor [Novosphingobium sp. TH158]PLK26853.1 TonB-dependent receptor [Novosphingobium sp. TH158]
MQFKSFLAVSAASVPLAIGLATPVYAQSTGSVDFEKEIIVTGTRGVQEVGGVSVPDTAKSKAVLTSENIQRQNPGQTILDTINQVPGVSFQNNDAYGSSGGTLNIRGFAADRVSLTFDGVPLNDSGNYAIYSNQQIDPELIEQVNVNLGTTDVDSPTASAAGGTVNYRTKKPDRDFGAMLSGSAGQFDFMRMFGKIETGDLTPGGIRAFVSASMARNDNPFNNYGKVDKQQYNARLYIPLAGDDFVSIAGHYNQNRTNFFGSLPLRLDAGRTVGSLSSQRFPKNASERKYLINWPCTIQPGVRGVADAATTCGSEYDRRFNPSNTGNIRITSRFTLADNLVLTVDPSFQYVKANGGGTVSAREGTRDIDPTSGTNNAVGYLGGSPYYGRDINGDGDSLDTVLVIAPSQTQTKRYGVIAGLRYDMDDAHTLRLNYTWDRARHRQTGETIGLMGNGTPLDVFPVNNPDKDSSGAPLQKRDRLSFAILHQVSAEYRGEYFDNSLVVTVGARMPFFKRDLTNNCFTSSASGFVECFSTNTALATTAQTLNPYSSSVNATTGAISVTGWAPPQNRIYNYKKLLPSAGFTYRLMDEVSLFGNFSQGLSVPGTDNLYNAFYFPLNTPNARPKPETTNNFDLGVRYRSGNIQAQLSGFYNEFKNRTASAYDPEINQTVYRNLGNVEKYGIDGSIAWQPVEALTFYAFGSILKSKIKNNLAIGENLDGTPIYALTAGKREAGAPKYTFGVTARGTLGPVELGITAKRTGERYIYDTNEAIYTGTFIANGAKNCSSATVCAAPTGVPSATKVYEATAAAYWLVNLDARVNLSFMGLNDKTYFQLNVYNLFDQFYVGGFGGNLNQNQTFCSATSSSSSNTCFNVPAGLSVYGSVPNVQIGAPRTVSGTLVFAF